MYLSFVVNFQEDTRRCLLCGLTRDAEPSGPGRLICCGLDEWVHVNCGLWSAEVFEDDEGRLQNVQAALSRGKQMVRVLLTFFVFLETKLLGC